jgi:DNA-directed RNA polymerase specialized sigma24 family protein
VSRRAQARPELRAGNWQALLQRLGSGTEEAAERYEQLRGRLIKYFVWEQCDPAEDLADECLDRVARKLDEGVEIQSVNAYVSGVARILVKECHARRRREQAMLEEFSNRTVPAEAPADVEQAVKDLEECCQQFSPVQRSLLLRFYEGDHRERILNRKKLAEELGMLPNALRNRAMRLRVLLENCMSARQARRDGTAAKATINRGAQR